MFGSRKPNRNVAKVTKQLDSASKSFSFELAKSRTNSAWISLVESYEKKVGKICENVDFYSIQGDNNAKQQFNKLIDRFIRECSTALYNIFCIRENIYTSTSIEENTKAFISEVNKIADYFGYEDFMKHRLYTQSDIYTAACNPANVSISVKDAISDSANGVNYPKAFENNGRPIPYNHRLFNSNLSRIIASFVKERNNYYIL